MKKIFALLLLVAALAASPVEIPKPPPNTSIAIPARRLAVELTENTRFRGTARLVDEIYISPHENLLPRLLNFCEKNRTKKYRENVWDCDDIAQEYKLNAEKWVMETWPDISMSLALAVAFVHIEGKVDGLYSSYSNSLHAIVVLRLADGRWIAIEPQTGKWILADSAIYEGTLTFDYLDF